MAQLIVNADDLGIAPGTNRAIRRGYLEGVITSASLMVNMPAAEDACQNVVATCPGMGVGLHLCLTSGRPVLPRSEVPLLVDSRGHFRHGFAGLWRLILRHGGAARDQIAAELAAQAERARAWGVPIDHINSHQHVHLIPSILPIAASIARRYRAAIRLPHEELWIRSVPAWWNSCLTNGGLAKKWLLSALCRHGGVATEDLARADRCYGILLTGRMTAAVVRHLAARLPEGTSEVLLHPGDSRPLREDVTCSGADRQFLASGGREAELDAVCDEGVRRLLEEHGVERIRFGDLASPSTNPGKTEPVRRSA